MKRRWILAAMVLMTSPCAYAAPWVVDAARSSLAFTGEQGGEKFSGSFKKFTPVIDFEAAKPERTNIRVSVDMASVVVEGKDRQEALPGAEWFDVTKFPKAELVVTKAVLQGSDKEGVKNYLAQAALTIRDKTKTFALPFSLKQEADGVTRAYGEVTLSRDHFDIGSGQFADEKWVKYAVHVRFDVFAKPNK